MFIEVNADTIKDRALGLRVMLEVLDEKLSISEALLAYRCIKRNEAFALEHPCCSLLCVLFVDSWELCTELSVTLRVWTRRQPGSRSI